VRWCCDALAEVDDAGQEVHWEELRCGRKSGSG
jgi:hypothetical protein